MTVKDKVKSFAITNRSRIELGLLFTILSFIAPPVYKAFAKIEVHSEQISRNTSDIKDLQSIHDDVGDIKRMVRIMSSQKRR
jgi:hypothetical protein